MGSIFITAKASLLLFFNLSAVKDTFFHYNLAATILFFGTFLWLLFKNRKKESFFILGLFLSYFFVYSLAFDGSFSGTGKLGGSYIRYIIILHLPLAIIAGYGFDRLFSLNKKNCWGLGLPVLLLLLLFVNVNFPGYRLDQPASRSLSSSLKFVSWPDSLNFYFPGYVFKDSRATRPGEACFIDPEPLVWSGIGKTPNGCLIIGSYNMVILNDYFKENRRKAALLDFIREDNQTLFADEFNKSQCIAFIDEGRCFKNVNKDDFACSFLSKTLIDEGLFFGGNNLMIHKMSVRRNP